MKWLGAAVGLAASAIVVALLVGMSARLGRVEAVQMPPPVHDAPPAARFTMAPSVVSNFVWHLDNQTGALHACSPAPGGPVCYEAMPAQPK